MMIMEAAVATATRIQKLTACSMEPTLHTYTLQLHAMTTSHLQTPKMQHLSSIERPYLEDHWASSSRTGHITRPVPHCRGTRLHQCELGPQLCYAQPCTWPATNMRHSDRETRCKSLLFATTMHELIFVSTGDRDLLWASDTSPLQLSSEEKVLGPLRC